ncbi:MAG TPA: helix-turn-helix domain-containing protein [Solirubrobacteraceae bacterium]
MTVHGRNGDSGTEARSARQRSQTPESFQPLGHTTIALDLPPELVEMIAQRAAEIVAEQVGAAVQTSPWLSTEQAADYIAAKPARVHDLVALGKLTPRRDGRRLLFKRGDLDAYLEASVA